MSSPSPRKKRKSESLADTGDESGSLLAPPDPSTDRAARLSKRRRPAAAADGADTPRTLIRQMTAPGGGMTPAPPGPPPSTGKRDRGMRSGTPATAAAASTSAVGSAPRSSARKRTAGGLLKETPRRTIKGLIDATTPLSTDAAQAAVQGSETPVPVDYSMPADEVEYDDGGGGGGGQTVDDVMQETAAQRRRRGGPASVPLSMVAGETPAAGQRVLDKRPDPLSTGKRGPISTITPRTMTEIEADLDEISPAVQEARFNLGSEARKITKGLKPTFGKSAAGQELASAMNRAQKPDDETLMNPEQQSKRRQHRYKAEKMRRKFQEVRGGVRRAPPPADDSATGVMPAPAINRRFRAFVARESLFVTTPALVAVREAVSSYWTNVAKSLTAYAKHREDDGIEPTDLNISDADVKLLFHRQRLTNDYVGFGDLARQYMSPEDLDKMVPKALAGNQITPETASEQLFPKSHGAIRGKLLMEQDEEDEEDDNENNDDDGDDDDDDYGRRRRQRRRQPSRKSRAKK